MAISLTEEGHLASIKRMPRDPSVRAAIRRLADEKAADLPGDGALTRAQLEEEAEIILDLLALPRAHLGFAMVAVNNARWRARFESVPCSRRLLLLPHCLSDRQACAGNYDSIGLQCARCGQCTISDLQARAEALGYVVIVAEGTSSVLMKVIDGEADAILGVACLDSLEKSYGQIAELGIPHLAVPLLQDGCDGTEAEIEEINTLLNATREDAVAQGASYLPLLRETHRIFTPASLAELLDSCLMAGADDPLIATDSMALEWLQEGGKRFRPFITLAAFVLGRHGLEALRPGYETLASIPDAVKRLALAIEIMHKASLVHDDIEDEDAVRYGLPTLHRRYGPALALNAGDFLVGLGYRLITGEVVTLGAACVADILAHLTAAHLDLCRGQGAELAWAQQTALLRPPDALAIYALKTAPAFEAALYAGLRVADSVVDPAVLKRFTIYLGEAYQVQDDLDDWDRDQREKGAMLTRAQAARPTILHAFALHAGGAAAATFLTDIVESPSERCAADLGAFYLRHGAFAQAERLLARLRERALAVTDDLGEPALQELFRFLVRVILPETQRMHGNPDQ